MNNILENKYFSNIYMFLALFICLFLFSSNFITAPYNLWVDINEFFTMGKSIMAGKILYTDIYSHKGPLWYFLYAGCSLMPKYFGIFIMEYLAGIILWISTRKFLQLFEVKNYDFLTLLFVVLCFSSRAFVTGGNVDEVVTGILMYSYYVCVKHIKEKSDFTVKEALLLGLGFGIIFWCKYTLVAIYIPIFIYFSYCFFKTDYYKNWLIAIGSALLGFFIVTALTLIYFLKNGNIGDLFQVYFYDNIFEYSQEIYGFFAILNNNIGTYIAGFPFIILLTLIGLVYFYKQYKEIFNFSIFCFLFSFSIITIHFAYDYYFYTLSIYAILGLIYISKYFENNNHKVLMVRTLLILIAGYYVGCGMKFYSLENYYYNGRVEYTYKISKIIGNDSFVMYDLMDEGFYYHTKQIPLNKYFYKPNISSKNFMNNYNEDFLNTIKTKDVKYIISAVRLPEDLIKDKYKLVMGPFPMYTCLVYKKI